MVSNITQANRDRISHLLLDCQPLFVVSSTFGLVWPVGLLVSLSFPHLCFPLKVICCRSPCASAQLFALLGWLASRVSSYSCVFWVGQLYMENCMILTFISIYDKSGLRQLAVLWLFSLFLVCFSLINEFYLPQKISLIDIKLKIQQGM